jgi:predicted transcriptional regulator
MPESKSAKKTTLELVERLNEDVTYDDIMYELYAIQKIERGLRDAEEGRTVSHDEVKDRLSQWLK